MLSLLRRFLGQRYHYLNSIEISSSKLLQNLSYLKSLDHQLKIAPVLKSNSYGHGLVEVAKILDLERCPYFCVDSLHEAYRLYQVGIKTPILIMGYINPENLKIKSLPFSYAVYDFEYLRKIHHYQPKAGIHLKVDTGMHRMGIPIQKLEKFLTEIKQVKDLKVEGLMSHLAITSDPKNRLLKLQLRNFQKAVSIVGRHGINPRWLHIAASGGFLHPEIRSQIAKFSNLVRAGRSLYGFDLGNKSELQPVLELSTTIAQIKKLRKGEMVGYDSTFKAKKPMVLAVLPIGYFDGVDRRLSNCGWVKINKVFCPIVGRVSMNITTVDVSSVLGIRVGDEVVIYSPNPKDKNSIQNAADICGTIAHEILVHLSPSTNRTII